MSSRSARRRGLRLGLPLLLAALVAAVATYRSRQLAASTRAFAERYGET